MMRVELPLHDVVAALIDAGWLGESEALDRGRVEAALAQLLAEWATRKCYR